MSIRARAVRVQMVPEITTAIGGRSFLHDVKRYAQSQRPRLVLDCSRLKILDNPTLAILLSCLEEVMRCNGDVRLASLCPEVEAAMRAAGINRLFEVYESPESAVNSFHHHATAMGVQSVKEESARRDSEHAA